MSGENEENEALQASSDSLRRPIRSDAKRNTDALLAAALAVFSISGVDAPVREIVETAGVGIGTLYRHFPQRADLIAAVFRREVDACADAAPALMETLNPADALATWLQRYTDFIAAKRGLAPALHSGDPAYATLHGYFQSRLEPVLQKLLDTAVLAGAVRSDVDANDLLRTVANLCMSANGTDFSLARRMVDLIVDGLRYGAHGKA